MTGRPAPHPKNFGKKNVETTGSQRHWERAKLSALETSQIHIASSPRDR